MIWLHEFNNTFNLWRRLSLFSPHQSAKKSISEPTNDKWERLSKRINEELPRTFFAFFVASHISTSFCVWSVTVMSCNDSRKCMFFYRRTPKGEAQHTFLHSGRRTHISVVDSDMLRDCVLHAEWAYRYTGFWPNWGHEEITMRWNAAFMKETLTALDCLTWWSLAREQSKWRKCWVWVWEMC